MTTPVCVRQRIRQLDRQGLSHREISRKLGVSRTTVVKYANHGDYSPKPLGSGHAGRSLVDAGYSAVVDGWPAADLRMPVKQCFASMSFQQAHQYFSAVWADGFPRSRHHAVSDVR